MAKGYIIEEVHVTGGSIRLRDSLTGKVVDVPLTPGSKLVLSEDGADDADAEESSTDDDDEADAAEEDAADDAADDADDAKPAARRRRRRKARARKAAERREANAEDVPALTVPRSRPVTEDPTPLVDESTLSDEDKAAVEQFQALMSKARGKRGGLGWKEITVDGRSGLQARWGKGQFKILQTGGDSYALFYEWDGGKWERIACGKADDLMRLAAARSEDEQPKAPLTTLTLEVARLFCGTPDQQDVAKTRLRPVRDSVQPEPEALHSPDKPRLNIRYSIAGETTSGPLVNVALQLHTGASKASTFQRDGVQLHSANSRPKDILEALIQEVIDQDDTKLLRRLGKFLDPVLPIEKFRELTESEEKNDTLVEDLVSAISASGVTFDNAGAAKAPRRATAEPSAKDTPRPPADEASEIEAKDKELISSFGDELENVLAEEGD